MPSFLSVYYSSIQWWLRWFIHPSRVSFGHIHHNDVLFLDSHVAKENNVIHGLDELIKFYQSPAAEHILLGRPLVNSVAPSECRRHGRTNLLHRATKEGRLSNLFKLELVPCLVSKLLLQGFILALLIWLQERFKLFERWFSVDTEALMQKMRMDRLLLTWLPFVATMTFWKCW